MIKEGVKVPTFTLPDQYGNPFQLEDLLGKKNLVIYFYPKDESAGCTKEACSFRDAYEAFKDANAEVIGISSDSVESHRSFGTHHRLPFILLSDEDLRVRKLYGVPSGLFGLLPGRVTYIIDRKGMVRYVFNSQLQIQKHVDNSLRFLREIESEMD